jgi:hypothetical protein
LDNEDGKNNDKHHHHGTVTSDEEEAGIGYWVLIGLATYGGSTAVALTVM